MTPRAVLALARVCACVAVAIAMPAPAADPAREVHGAADVFVAPGVALAWGVLRGATDATTIVVVRIAADPAQFASVAAAGRDPFTQQTKTLLPATPTIGALDLRVPRAHFAEFPRTELSLYDAAAAAPARSATPKLVVFYLGVPDTTPELASEAALETYLAERIAGLRGRPEGNPR